MGNSLKKSASSGDSVRVAAVSPSSDDVVVYAQVDKTKKKKVLEIESCNNYVERVSSAFAEASGYDVTMSVQPSNNDRQDESRVERNDLSGRIDLRCFVRLILTLMRVYGSSEKFRTKNLNSEVSGFVVVTRDVL